jgi:hypothetical protein
MPCVLIKVLTPYELPCRKALNASITIDSGLLDGVADTREAVADITEGVVDEEHSDAITAQSNPFLPHSSRAFLWASTSELAHAQPT